MRKELRRMDSIPKWYGVAYLNDYCMTAICYPIPLNLIVRLWKDIIWSLKIGCFKSQREEALIKAHNSGREDMRESNIRALDREMKL